MAIILADVLNETKEKYELNILAGENGCNREMNWVYVAEEQANASFLKEGELIISTGALYDHTEKWLLHFIKTLYSCGTCGLILNVGKHVLREDITEALISFCNKHAFPLLTMPWHIHIYDITRDYYDRIFADAQKNPTLDFSRLLFEINDKSLLDRYVEEKLGAVLKYDKEHNSDLTDTLYLYLKYWGNIQKIAAESFYHRNTITNRLKILTEQCNCHPDNPAERFELMAAFKIREFNTLQRKT